MMRCMTFAFFADDEVGEAPQVTDPFLEGRQFQNEDGKPVIQVFTECSLFDEFHQILVGRRDDPDIHGVILSSPTRDTSFS